jgi:hypothetical protein
MEALIKLKGAGWSSAEYKILGIAEAIEWFEGSPCKDVDLIYFSELFRYTDLDCQEEEVNDLVKELPRWFLSQLVKKQEKDLRTKSWGPTDPDKNKQARMKMKVNIKLITDLYKI